MTFRALIQRGNRFFGAVIRPVRSAVFCIFQPFRHMPVHETLGRKGYFPVLHARFQKVADLDMYLLADMLGNDNLKPVFYGDDVHKAAFFSLTVSLAARPGGGGWRLWRSGGEGAGDKIASGTGIGLG